MAIRRDILPRRTIDFIATGVFLVMIPVYYYFELCVVLPRFHEQWSAAYIIHVVMGHFILFQIYVHLFAIAMCDTSIKGRVMPTNLKPDWKFCSICESAAPPRSFHCNVCNVCILKRDHHCIFASYCVGHDNHRYFMVFVFYMQIATLYVSFYNMRFMMNFVTFDYSWKSIFKMVFPLATLVMEWTQNQFFIVLILLALFESVFSGTMLYFNIKFMLRGVVLYERNAPAKYNRGKLENIKLVLGERWYLVWISPWIESKLPCDGIRWGSDSSPKNKLKHK